MHRSCLAQWTPHRPRGTPASQDLVLDVLYSNFHALHRCGAMDTSSPLRHTCAPDTLTLNPISRTDSDRETAEQLGEDVELQTVSLRTVYKTHSLPRNVHV